MGKWAVVLTDEQYAHERLYANESVTGYDVPAGDEALLVAVAEEPMVFAIGRGTGDGRIAYVSRMLDEPVTAEGLRVDGPGAFALADEAFGRIARRVGAERRVDADKQTYLVSVDLPIEAASPAEAVRAFWSYVRELGPGELPALVRPTGDELAMQAYVLGEESNQDPEEEETAGVRRR